MAKLVNTAFTGISGRTYRFGVFPLDAHFRDMGAVYVFSRRTVDSSGKENHTPVYIGQTRELSEGLSMHKRRPSLKQSEENCVCIHVDWDEKLRTRIAEDLTGYYNPTGNN